MSEKPGHRFLHRWHVAINAHSEASDYKGVRWMYDAKNAASEVPRLAYWFRLERRGEMPKLDQACSRTEPYEVPDNHLTCCLGVECRACPHLKALDGLEGNEQDTAKAWTCVAHIISDGGDPQNEGFILTTGDRMYWDRVYTSLSMDEPGRATHTGRSES